MSFRSITQVGVVSLTILLGFAVQAATLDPVQGGILVSRAGGPYQTVSQPIQLQVGDSVLANPGGVARVVYENGCVAEVRPGMVFIVSEPPPCSTDDVAATESSDYTALAIGAAVVGGGVGIALAVSGGGGGGGGGSP